MLLIFLHVKEQNVHQKKALAEVWSHEQATWKLDVDGCKKRSIWKKQSYITPSDIIYLNYFAFTLLYIT